MDRQLQSYFLSCFLTWVAQFNLRISLIFKSFEEKLAICLSWVLLKHSCVFEVLKLYQVVTCELGLELLKILEDVFGPFMSVHPEVAASEKDALLNYVLCLKMVGGNLGL